MLYQLSYFRKNKPHQGSLSMSSSDACNPDRFRKWEEMDSNHRRRTPADLQSAPFGHSGIFPNILRYNLVVVYEPMEGFEPTTPRLQITCSGQLSYIGIQPLRDAKVGIFFMFANFFRSFFSKFLFFLLSTALLSTFKELPTPDSYYIVGKSSANIITLSLIKKQLNVFFAKKLKKYHFAIHLYLYIIDFWWLRP